MPASIAGVDRTTCCADLVSLLKWLCIANVAGYVSFAGSSSRARLRSRRRGICSRKSHSRENPLFLRVRFTLARYWRGLSRGALRTLRHGLRHHSPRIDLRKRIAPAGIADVRANWTGDRGYLRGPV